MALGLALALFLASLPPSNPCDLVVQGRDEPSPYLDAVRLYRDGKRDEAMHALAALGDAELDRFIERIGALREKFQPSAIENFVPDDVCFEAASLLEVELGMTLAETSRWDAADAHFQAGWRVSFLIDSSTLRARFQRDWLLVVGLKSQELIFQSPDPQPAFERADRFLQNGCRLSPRDSEVLMAAGALLEFSGSLPEGNRDHLKRAESLYDQALRISPDDPEALVRRGWVLKKLGKTQEAAPALQRVLGLTTDDNLIYRSRLGLGAVAESEGRLDEAVAEYEAASRVEPGWQVAYLAWAEALHRQGSHARARQVLGRAVGMAYAEARKDRWWEYELGLVPHLGPLLDRMRSEAAK